MGLETGQYEQAREDFEKVLALDPSNREAMKGLARANEILSRRETVPVEPPPGMAVESIQDEPVEPSPRVEQEWSIPEKEVKEQGESLVQWLKRQSRALAGLVILVVALYIGLAALSIGLTKVATTLRPGYSRAELSAYLKQAQPLWEEFEDTLIIAGSTARIALSPIVSDLQKIRRDFRRLEPPAIAQTAHNYFIEGMQYSIDAFLAFMAQESDARVERLFESARRFFAVGYEAIEKAKAEARW